MVLFGLLSLVSGLLSLISRIEHGGSHNIYKSLIIHDWKAAAMRSVTLHSLFVPALNTFFKALYVATGKQTMFSGL